MSVARLKKDAESTVGISVDSDIAKGLTDLDKFNAKIDETAESLEKIIDAGPKSKESLQAFNRSIAGITRRISTFSETIGGTRQNTQAFGKSLSSLAVRIQELTNAAGGLSEVRKDVTLLSAELSSKLDFGKLTTARSAILGGLKERFEKSASAEGVGATTLETIRRLARGEIDLTTATKGSTAARATAIKAAADYIKALEQINKAGSDASTGGGRATKKRVKEAESFLRQMIGTIPADSTKAQLNDLKSATEQFMSGIKSKKFKLQDAIFGDITSFQPKVLAAKALIEKVRASVEALNSSGAQSSKAARLEVLDKFLATKVPTKISDATTPQAINRLNAAVQNLRKGVASGKLDINTVVFGSKGSGAFNANTLAATAAVQKLNQAIGSLNAVGTSEGGFFNRIKKNARDTLIFSTLYRTITGVEHAIKSSTTEAADYIIKINEIRSINQEAGDSFAYISDKVQSLSIKLGLPALDVAEAAYQTLSNQVAKGADSFKFLETAGRLSVASVSSVTTSVNALSTVINAYGLNISEAERVSAQLFKAVEVGRFRLQELDPALAKIIPTAASLGISFEEVLAAVSAFTIRGVKIEQASTLINNVMLGLLKPTKEAVKFFNELGYESGVTALRGLKLSGVFKALNDELQRNPERLAKVANDMRELRAVALVSGKTFETYVEDIDKISNATDNFSKAVGINLNNAGRDFKRFEQIWNTGWRALGVVSLKTFNSFTAGLEVIGTKLGILDTDTQKVISQVETSVLSMSSVFQTQNTEIDNALKNTNQILRKNIAADGAKAYQQINNIQARLDVLKTDLKEGSPSFVLRLTDELKEAERAANQARNQIEKIQGSGAVEGLLAKNRTELTNLLRDRDLNRPLNDRSGKQLTSIQELRRLQDEIAKSGKSAKGFDIQGDTLEDVEAATKRLLELENRIDGLRGTSGQRLVSYRQVSTEISQIYAAQEQALQRILVKQEEIRKSKEAEVESARKNEAAAKNIIADIGKFDLTKIKDPSKAREEFGRLLQRVGENDSLFKQDASFNTALNLRLSLLKEQLELIEKTKVENTNSVKIIEAGTKAAQAQIEVLKQARDVKRQESVLAAGKALAGIQGFTIPPLQNSPEIAANNESASSELLEFIRDPTKTQNLARAIVAWQESRALLIKAVNTPGSNVTDQDRVTFANISDQIAIAREALAEGTKAENDIKIATEALSNANLNLKGTYESLGNSMNPVIAKFRDTSAMAKSTLAVYEYIKALQILQKTFFDTFKGEGVPLSDNSEEPTQRFGGRTFRYGGKGSDTRLAMLSPREIVMNAQASKTFYTQLSAMNRGQNPRSYSAGGPASVTNVGDVHVSITGTQPSSQMVRAIGSGIQREIRRGTLG